MLSRIRFPTNRGQGILDRTPSLPVPPVSRAVPIRHNVGMGLRKGTMCLSLLLATATLAPAAPVAAGATATPAAPISNAAPLGPLTELLVERLQLGDQVAASKFGTDKPIDDPQREQELLAAVGDEATALGIDADAAVALFEDQITASKVVQRGLFERWTQHPDEAPTERPDLDQLREQLDALTHAILRELTTTEELRHGDPLCGVHLTTAAISASLEHRLDSLHRQALHQAVDTVCLPD